MKAIKLNVTKDKLIEHNIIIFSGYYKLTDLEQRLLASIVKYYVSLKEKILDDSLFKENFLSSTHRTLIREEFSFSNPALTKYLTQLRNKKVIKKEDGTYSIDSKFLPADKVLFEFKIVD